MRTYSQSGFKRPRPDKHYTLSLLTFTYILHEYSALYLTILRKVHGMRFPVCVGSGKASASSREWKAPPLI